jgi:alpha-L-rhamnosidase
MRCEYQDMPLGIDHSAPRLSWTLESEVRGQKQTAYRVLVARSIEALQSDRGDLWDSGRVESSQSVNIPYAGEALVSGLRCHWKVMTWGANGTASAWSTPSYWEMGLLKPSDWKGRWIGDGKPLPETDAGFFSRRPGATLPQTLPTFRTGEAGRVCMSAPWDTSMPA